jgi:hypothetical protein
MHGVLKVYGQDHFVKKLMIGKSIKQLSKMLKVHPKLKNQMDLGG